MYPNQNFPMSTKENMLERESEERLESLIATVVAPGQQSPRRSTKGRVREDCESVLKLWLKYTTKSIEAMESKRLYQYRYLLTD
jgi:hypothetical protein